MTDAKNAAWADLPPDQIEELIERSRELGWRAALDSVRDRAPFFVHRMSDLALVNWHVLLGRSPSDSVLDLGCGFGSSVLGLGACYRQAVGVEFLSDRVRYSALRARQERRGNCVVTRGDGHRLPFRDALFGLAILNGVLEWAALYDYARSPFASQVAMLAEVRRVLAPDGQVAVAIENRFAAESLMGMKDTHSGLTGVTMMPRWVANGWSRLLSGIDYRTWLFGPRGYAKLFRAAGFENVRLFDLISSYNDYDFVVEVGDRLSYRFLYREALVRDFYGPAAQLRQVVRRVRPGWLGCLSYAYLVVAGDSVASVLDSEHALWDVVGRWGLGSGAARFACKGTKVGSMLVVAHEGDRLGCLIELGSAGDDSVDLAESLPETARRGWCESLRHVGSTEFEGRTLKAYGSVD